MAVDMFEDLISDLLEEPQLTVDSDDDSDAPSGAVALAMPTSGVVVLASMPAALVTESMVSARFEEIRLLFLATSLASGDRIDLVFSGEMLDERSTLNGTIRQVVQDSITLSWATDRAMTKIRSVLKHKIAAAAGTN